MAAAEGMPQGLLALGDIMDRAVLEYVARQGDIVGRRGRRAQADSPTPHPTCFFCKKQRVNHYGFCREHKNLFNHMIRSAKKHSDRAHWFVKVAHLFVHTDHRFAELMLRYKSDCPRMGHKRRADFDWDSYLNIAKGARRVDNSIVAKLVGGDD